MTQQAIATLLLLLQAVAPLSRGGPMRGQLPPMQTKTQPRPDVVVFFLDDVGARDVELLSSEVPSRVPNLDALASSGTLFPAGYAQPMCAPARWSIMLSDWEGGHAGFACNPNTDGTGPGPQAGTLRHGIQSLPKAMDGAGYSTGLFGRWGLGTWLGDDPGTQEFAWTPMLWGFSTWRAGIPDGVEFCNGTQGANYFNWLRVDDGEVTVANTQAQGVQAYNTIAIADEFLGWWPSAVGPRFAFVALQAAHKPFHFPPPEAMPAGWMPTGSLLRDKYEAVVQSADHAIGRMMAVIDLETTLVVLLADNGTPEFVPPPGYSSTQVKFSTFNGGVRVPFVVAGLGFPAGQTSTQPVSIVDLVPSLMDIAGVCSSIPEWDGQSFIPALDGIALPRGWVYVQAPSTSTPNLDKAVIEAEWKLRERPSGSQFLYNLALDPLEGVPIDPDAPGFEEITARLRSEMAEAQE